MSDTIARVKDILTTRLKLNANAEQINENTQLFGPDGLGLDSIDVLELVVGIKKEFGVEILDRQTAEKVFTTVGAIAEYVEKNKI